MADDIAQDGRRARRERSRAAIIDAVFGLVQEGKVPPQVEDIADRAGVSVSSVFRNFDGLADLQHQALESFAPRFARLFVVDDAGDDLSARIRSHVRMRVELYAAAGGLMRVGRARALDHEPMVEGVARLRGRLADQARQRFAVELDRLSPAEAANLVAVIDAMTSPDAFDVMSSAHARTPRQISKTWITALDALLAVWVNGSEHMEQTT
jgi:AcrR family transcriptional regulator